MNTFARALFALLILQSLGCGLLSSAMKSDGGASTPETVDRLDVAEDASKATQTSEHQKDSTSDVEVLWQVPLERVEGFQIAYGYSRNDLPHKVKVSTEELEEIEDPVHGDVYRYVIAGVPLDKSVFITIAAYSGEKRSRQSDVFELKADPIPAALSH